MNCPAMLTIGADTYPCDWPADEQGKHPGWGRANRGLQALWYGDPAELDVAVRGPCRPGCPICTADQVGLVERLRVVFRDAVESVNRAFRR